MKCPKCQSEISDDSRFCSKCGTPIHPSEEIFISQTRTILRPMKELFPGTTLAAVSIRSLRSQEEGEWALFTLPSKLNVSNAKWL